ncbi:MAG: hypothetical protein WAN72_05005 [Candidatus Acidiferrales bacterium]
MLCTAAAQGLPVTFDNTEAMEPCVTLRQRWGDATTMIVSRSGRTWIATLFMTVVLVVAAFKTGAQDKPKRETIQAQAMGQNRAAGKNFNVTVSIDSYSTPDDQKQLISAFNQGGQAALSKSLSKMQSKGRVAVTGTLGYSVAYVRTFPTAEGRRVRLITDRPIRFAEARENGRSTDYDISALEFDINKDKSKSSGSLIIGLRVKVDKDNQFVFESYGSGPWKLVNVMER